MKAWRAWSTEEATIELWSRVTGTPTEFLREGMTRRDFLRGLGAAVGVAASPKALARHPGGKVPWVPPDEDPRWETSDWTGLKGFAMIAPDLVEDNDQVAGGSFTALEYKERLKNWRKQDLRGALFGQRGTIVHGNPAAGRGLGLPKFELKDERRLQGRIKLPISWSLMYDEYAKRTGET